MLETLARPHISNTNTWLGLISTLKKNCSYMYNIYFIEHSKLDFGNSSNKGSNLMVELSLLRIFKYFYYKQKNI